MSNHNLSYPLNVEGDPQQGHYIMFMINKATSAKIKNKVSKAANLLKAEAESAGFESEEDNAALIDSQLNKGAGKNSVETFRSAPKGTGLWMHRPGTTRMAKAITLYMPPSVKVDYKSNYKNDEISTTASAIGSSIGGIVDAMSGKGSAGDALTTMAEGGVAIAAFAAKAMADTAAPGASTLAQLSAGSILGSKMEVMFTDVGRRNFSFEFNFIPKSEQEAKMVYKIVQTFKEHMLPEYLTSIDLGAMGKHTLGGGRVLSIPDTFDIKYFYHSNENPFLNKISTCYLTSMDIDYGGDKYVTYEPTELNDGQVGPPPQRTSISLAFTEIETITRERAQQGF